MRLFSRYWAWLAALPVLLLFLAVYRRIADYGVTEQRYVMLLIGVWILVLAAIRLWQGGNFDLRVVPGLLALFLLAASFGPGGAIGFSVMSQTGQLQQILAAKGMLVDGRFVALKADENSDPPLGRSGARARSIVWYLNEHRSLGLLAPWFETASPNPFAEGKTPETTERDVILALGLRPNLSRTPGIAYFTHYSDVPVAVATTGSNYVLGPIEFQHLGPVPAPIPSQSVAVEGLGNVELDLADNPLTARVGTGDALSFNIVDAVKEIYRRGWPRTTDQRPVSLKGSGGALTGTLLIDNLNGAYEEPNFDLTLLRFWLVLNKAP